MTDVRTMCSNRPVDDDGEADNDGADWISVYPQMVTCNRIVRSGQQK